VAPALLRELEEAGLVTLAEEVRTRGAQIEVWLEPARDPAPADGLARAPRRAAVLARIRDAARISLDQLREAHDRAAAHVRPQLASRFRGRFGPDVAVLHSGLSDAERADAFRRIQRGQVSIALGARSAVFAPFEGAHGPLGVIIVDEEHDPSFKQQEGVRYHG